jgi:siroheme synthase-like protein
VTAPSYPVHLILEGRRCLVVGGGSVAARKAESLLASGAAVHVIAPNVSDEVKALPVTFDERPYHHGDADGYRLVIAATDDSDVNRAVYLDGEAAGVWVNGADDPVHCSFTLPSVLRRGDLIVTVGTSGRSPALARWLRDQLAREVGPEYEVLLDLLAEARDSVKAVGGSTEAVDWQTALDSDMLDLIRNGQVAAARERLKACLSSSSD